MDGWMYPLVSSLCPLPVLLRFLSPPPPPPPCHHSSWSECAVDDTDDGYMGDNRDGDEQWYQYRTQEFCANAAYSLYGVKKGQSSLFSTCTRGHFINSFFTYGGADNLLLAIGKQPTVYYSNYDDDDGEDDDNNHQNSNAKCVELERDDDDDERRHLRQLSGSNDENAFTSTMGCSAEGSFVVASFEANNCNGNYYAGILDTFDKYNKQQENIGCHRIWRRASGDATSIMYLMNNSWTCDLDLYPNGCPDPYGKKARYDYALKTIAHGGNANWAYKNMMLKRPMHFTSILFAILASFLIVFTYYVKNRDRMVAKSGGIVGFFRCLGEDIAIQIERLGVYIMSTIRAKRKERRRRERQEKAAAAGAELLEDDGIVKKKKKKKSKSGDRHGKHKKDKERADRYTAEMEQDGYIMPEEPAMSASGEYA